MKKATIVGGVIAIVLVLAMAGSYWRRTRLSGLAEATRRAAANPMAEAEGAAHESCLYGRVTTVGGATYEGRLRFGGDEEAFWGDYFNGYKKENAWAAKVPPGQLPKERLAIKIFGLEVAHRERAMDLGRPFLARFGDIAHIEAHGRDVRVTLKSGSMFELDRFSASDFDDGIRVWDRRRGMMDLDNLRIRRIEFQPAPESGAVPNRLHGTVHTGQGDFTGFVQWDREECLGSDEIYGDSGGNEVRIRFDRIRSIERHSSDSSLVKLLDGREIVLSGTRKAGLDNLGIYADDARYGRVLVTWKAFERVDFSPGGSGPAYGDFPPGGPITGSITTRDGRRLAGRLVYDLDESEVTETLDAPRRGVDYTIPFGLIARIMLPDPEERETQPARVTLHSGEEMQLECAGDLGGRNAGMLVFAAGAPRPEYVPWMDVEQIDIDRPRATYPR